ncbi:elongation factor TS-domain-containing protein [Glomus cerebriforme]|uniref:Elongation factor Ts, mitochondrial n=1 Tax=Glomus cerebriforme TaxID=658196 RepID=A0A397TM65_9GLOM|nr:elongation factor TS-domain-containing protein [Glomus cerebriforme]
MFQISRKFPLAFLSPSRSYLFSSPINANRLYTTIKLNLKLLQQLRQETQVSITKAKEALIKHDNDYEIALSWILEDSKTSGVAKAEKLKGRIAKEGLIGIALTNSLKEKEIMDMGNTRGAIIEVNCETDFVSRNTLFQKFVTQIASTSLLLSSDITPISSSSSTFIQPIPLSLLQSSPLLPHPSSTSSDLSLATTVQESTVELVGKLGENISLRRAEAVVFPDTSNVINEDSYILTGGYIHGGDSFTGKIGGLVVIKLLGKLAKQNSLHSSEQITKLLRNLARQVVGFNPKYINENNIKTIQDGINKNDYIKENVLLNQDFIIGGGSVKDVIKEKEKELGVGIEIVDFKRWERGEGIEESKGTLLRRL